MVCLLYKSWEFSFIAFTIQLPSRRIALSLRKLSDNIQMVLNDDTQLFKMEFYKWSQPELWFFPVPCHELDVFLFILHKSVEILQGDNEQYVADHYKITTLICFIDSRKIIRPQECFTIIDEENADHLNYSSSIVAKGHIHKEKMEYSIYQPVTGAFYSKNSQPLVISAKLTSNISSSLSKRLCNIHMKKFEV